MSDDARQVFLQEAAETLRDMELTEDEMAQLLVVLLRGDSLILDNDVAVGAISRCAYVAVKSSAVVAAMALPDSPRWRGEKAGVVALLRSVSMLAERVVEQTEAMDSAAGVKPGETVH